MKVSKIASSNLAKLSIIIASIKMWFLVLTSHQASTYLHPPTQNETPLKGCISDSRPKHK